MAARLDFSEVVDWAWEGPDSALVGRKARLLLLDSLGCALSGMRYGCIPITSRTGGLSDTVIAASHATLASGVATGVQLPTIDQANLEYTLDFAADCFADPALWQQLQKNAMAQDVSWTRSAADYAKLYRSLLSDGPSPIHDD